MRKAAIQQIDEKQENLRLRIFQQKKPNQTNVGV